MIKRGLNNSTLKMIALVTMLIDHIGASILQRMLLERGVLQMAASGIRACLQLEYSDRVLAVSWWIMRLIIGRIAFPIFCFLLVEGFVHTGSVWRYAKRLFIFALLSEIPFDIALFHKWFDLRHQNVFFTLLIGLCCMQGFRLLDEWNLKGVRNGFAEFLEKYQAVWILLLKGVIAACGMGLAGFLHTDYKYLGVAFILVLYVFKEYKFVQTFAGALGSALILDEFAAPLAFVFIFFYNGKRGLSVKYLFYLFYPIHLLVLYGLCVLLKLT